MASEQQIEQHLYRAITRGRLSARSHTLDRAMQEIKGAADRSKVKPWSIVGVDRRTWQRWRAGTSRPRPGTRTHAGLLAALRRLRLPAAREARLRAGKVDLRLWSHYEQTERRVGARTLAWAGTGPVIDAYLSHGIGAAREKFLQAIRTDHFQSWLEPRALGSQQSYDIRELHLDKEPPERTGTRPGTRRRR